eukprot:6181280-Pleurochrysis_carterae.AAC.1
MPPKRSNTGSAGRARWAAGEGWDCSSTLAGGWDQTRDWQRGAAGLGGRCVRARERRTQGQSTGVSEACKSQRPAGRANLQLEAREKHQ